MRFFSREKIMNKLGKKQHLIDFKIDHMLFFYQVCYRFF